MGRDRDLCFDPRPDQEARGLGPSHDSSFKTLGEIEKGSALTDDIDLFSFFLSELDSSEFPSDMKMELLENLIRKLPLDLWFVANRVKFTTKGIMIDREIEALKNRGFDRP